MMASAILAWLGSIGLMLGALYFQYFQGLDPCVLCIYQRIPHIIAIFGGALAIAKFPRLYPWIGAIVLIGVGVALFHVGVEQKWWEGLSTCSAAPATGVASILDKQPARCDEIAWSFLSLSMAAWNAILSLGIAALWFKAKP